MMTVGIEQVSPRPPGDSADVSTYGTGGASLPKSAQIPWVAGVFEGEGTVSTFRINKAIKDWINR